MSPQIVLNGADWFNNIGTAEIARHGDLRPDRQDQPHRPD
jgi:hypothetical protein